MSPFLRASLVLIQAAFNHAASTPPNKTQTKFRYHTEAPLLFEIAPLIVKVRLPSMSSKLISTSPHVTVLHVCTVVDRCLRGSHRAQPLRRSVRITLSLGSSRPRSFLGLSFSEYPFAHLLLWRLICGDRFMYSPPLLS